MSRANQPTVEEARRECERSRLLAPEVEARMRDIDDADRCVWIHYRNHRGEVAWRHVLPQLGSLRFATTEWHGDAWVFDGIDLDKGAWRTFAMKDVLAWRPEIERVPG